MILSYLHLMTAHWYVLYITVLVTVILYSSYKEYNLLFWPQSQ